ncbi:hypothetical protein LP416_14835 [Polaromonas sp. P2-4]|nr:hypothetical protein LP416_14835 [Polaromonas sp. P2-4]
MRRQFNDPLFVRTGSGMMPTPHAVALVQPLRQALELLRVATQQQVVFDPSSSTRHFHIAMTDISHLEFLPSLINKIGKLAPDIRVDVLLHHLGNAETAGVGRCRPGSRIHAGTGGGFLPAETV